MALRCGISVPWNAKKSLRPFKRQKEGPPHDPVLSICAPVAAKKGEPTMKSQDDGYGTTFREAMRKSMAEPAKWRPMNHLDRCRCPLCHQDTENRLGAVRGFLWVMAGLLE